MKLEMKPLGMRMGMENGGGGEVEVEVEGKDVRVGVVALCTSHLFP